MRLIWVCFVFTLFFRGYLLSEEEEEGLVVVSATEVLEGPYFALGDLIEISGVVKGDAFLIGTQVILNGRVEGNLYVLAGSFEMNGALGGNAWIVAGGTSFAGVVEGNVNILSASAQMGSSGKIRKDLLVCAGNVELENFVAQDVTVLASNVKVLGSIGHDMRSFAGKLKLSSTAKVGGDLTYKSNKTAWIDSKAQIGGTVQYKRSLFYDLIDIPVLKGLIIGSKVAAFLMNFIYTFVIGVVLIRMFPKKLHKTLAVLHEVPLKACLYGITLLIVLPIASLLLLATVIGAPFALTLIALNIVSFYTVKIFVILWGMNALFSHWRWKKNSITALITGQIVYCMITLIPLIGPFVAIACMVIGLGAVAVAETR